MAERRKGRDWPDIERIASGPAGKELEWEYVELWSRTILEPNGAKGRAVLDRLLEIKRQAG